MRLFHLIAFVGSLTACWEGAQARAPGYRIVSTISDVGGSADFSTFDPVQKRLYIARSDRVSVFDVKSGILTSMLAPAKRAHAIVVVRNGSEILVTESDTNTATFRSSKTGQLLATVFAGEKPDAALLEPRTGLILVMNHQSGDVTFIDPDTRAKVASVFIGGTLESAASDGRGKVYINIEDTGQIAVLNAVTRKVESRIVLPDCHSPTGLSYAPDPNILVAACENEVAVAIDLRSHMLVGRSKIGKGADAVIYDSRRRVFFIPAGESGDLAEVAAVEGHKLQTRVRFQTRRGARSGAVDETKGYIYLPAADYLAARATNGRPTMIPGSFRLLIIAPGDAYPGSGSRNPVVRGTPKN